MFTSSTWGSIACDQALKERIAQHYRIRLILDNLPVTTYDLADSPESIRPGFEVGYEQDGKFFVNNHIMFTILLHRTNGQYTRAQKDFAAIEAAAEIEVSNRHKPTLHSAYVHLGTVTGAAFWHLCWVVKQISMHSCMSNKQKRHQCILQVHSTNSSKCFSCFLCPHCCQPPGLVV